jgi:8-oxo-dGTP pyrophosphatase MutT (NUDIX family)
MGGHVDEGETYFDAAKREMLEELGLDHEKYALTEVTEPYLNNGFFSAMYKVIVPDDLEIDFDPEEVAEILWLTPEEVDRLIVEKALECTSSLSDSWIPLRDKLISI